MQLQLTPLGALLTVLGGIVFGFGFGIGFDLARRLMRRIFGNNTTAP
jgi:hypothetical protein